MNRALLASFCALVCIPMMSYAKGNSMMLRGGYGFLYPDGNSFVNGGQMALTSGLGIEALYARRNINPKLEVLTPSMVWGNGKFGMGAFVTRTGSVLTGNSNLYSDSAGAALGLALAQGRVTIGGEAERSISRGQTNDGTVNASINLNGNKRMGFSAGVGAGTTLNQAGGNVKTGTASIGWGFTSLSSISAEYKITDFRDPKYKHELSGYLNLATPSIYFGAGYTHIKIIDASQLKGRLGYVFGSFDLSVHCQKILLTGQEPIYGGSLRLAL